MSDLVTVGAKVQPSIRDWLAEFALEQRTSVSDVIRCSIAEYLSNHTSTDEEREAAETIKRRRFENMKLEIPKDEFNSLLFPSRVRGYVDKIKFSWDKHGFLTPERFDYLISFVEKEVKVIQDNPCADVLTEMLGQIISDLQEDQARMQGKVE